MMAVNRKQVMIMLLKGMNQSRVAGAVHCNKRGVACAARAAREHGVTMECVLMLLFIAKSVFRVSASGAPAGGWLWILDGVGFAEHEGLADVSAWSGELDDASVVDDVVDDRGASLSSVKIVFYLLNSMFVVKMMLRRS